MTAPNGGATRPIAGSRFVIASHGTEHEPPMSGVWQFLMQRNARRVDLVFHPLNPEDGDRHRHTVLEQGARPRSHSRALPTFVPYTYPLDALWPVRVPRAEAWLCFNNLLAARGLAERRLARTERVVYWPVDFVRDRFGAGSPLTSTYDALDAYCCRHVDHRVELSHAARDARDARDGLTTGRAPTSVVPMGAWVDRVPTVPEDGDSRRRLVFIGHLVPRMGLELGLEALARVIARGVDAHLDVAGHGPQSDELRARCAALGLERHVTFHGFIADHGELDRLVAGASVALAPYVPDPDSFSRFADPSKIKVCLAAGLPLLLTDVPPNAAEVAAEGGAEIVAYDAGAWADAIERVLGDPETWRARRARALAYARRFDFNRLFEDAFTRFGFQV